MKWYIILIPFITLFVFAGLRWSSVTQQYKEINSILENSMYSSVDLYKVSEYSNNIVTEDVWNQIIKYTALTKNQVEPYEIEFRKLNDNPQLFELTLNNYFQNVNYQITKMIAIDATE